METSSELTINDDDSKLPWIREYQSLDITGFSHENPRTHQKLDLFINLQTKLPPPNALIFLLVDLSFFPFPFFPFPELHQKTKEKITIVVLRIKRGTFSELNFSTKEKREKHPKFRL